MFSMKSSFRVFLLSVLLVCSTSFLWASETITILHVNDFHGRIFPYSDKTVDKANPVGGAAYLAALITNERRMNQDGTILLSAGDMFQGTPVSNLHYGRPVVEFMNMVGFDAMTLGNHEFDWGRDVLDGIVRTARFPLLCANIQDMKGRYLPGARPYVIVERKGYKIGIIGLTTPSVIHMVNRQHLRDTRVLQPDAVIPDLVKEVRGKGADVVILLTHLGFDVDQQVAASLQGVNIIVGGHSHTVVTDAVKVGDVLVAQAGYNGLYLGIVTVVLEKKDGRVEVLDKKGRLQVVSAAPSTVQDKAVTLMADGYEEKIRARFQEVVGETKVDLIRRGDGQSPLGDVISDAMRETSGADVAFQNAGGIRADILKGKIAMEQVFTVLPFDNVLVTMDLSGADLLTLFETGSGEGRGMLQLSGATVIYDLARPVGNRVVRVEINGTALDAARTYKVVTNDFLAVGGDRFSAFNNGKNVKQGQDLRDAFVAYLRRHSPLDGAGTNRIIVKDR
jgi:5'-nucleotidase / UDP-sugar diphosphatase